MKTKYESTMIIGIRISKVDVERLERLLKKVVKNNPKMTKNKLVTTAIKDLLLNNGC